MNKNKTESSCSLKDPIGGVLFLLLGLISLSIFSVTPLKAQSSQQRPTLFATLAEYVASNGLGFVEQRHLRQLKIDPHLIDTTYRSSAKLQNKFLAGIPDKEIRRHKNVLEKLGVPTTDAVADQACIGSGGLPEPPDPDKPDIERTSSYPPHCEEQGFFLTVIFEKPQPAADTKCRVKKSQHVTGGNAHCWKVKAYEFTSYSYFFYAIYLNRDPRKGWMVVRKKSLGGFAS